MTATNRLENLDDLDAGAESPATSKPPIDDGAESKVIDEIGARLRAARKARRLSTGQVAVASGLTRGFLSQLERDMTSASLSTIARICDALGMRVGELFESGRADVVRREERPRIEYSHRQTTEHLLTPPSNGRLEAYDSRIGPGTRSDDSYTMRATVGFIYVLAGTLVFQVGDNRYQIWAGDSLTYSPAEPHSWHNPSAVDDARVIWVVTGWPATSG